MCQIGFVEPNCLAHIKAMIPEKILISPPGHTVLHQLLHFPLSLTVDDDRYAHLLAVTPTGKALQQGDMKHIMQPLQANRKSQAVGLEAHPLNHPVWTNEPRFKLTVAQMSNKMGT